MTISIIVITANPTAKQYAWREALASYNDLADEVIVVDGGTEQLTDLPSKVKVIHIPDPEIWNWAEHAKRLNTGLLEATGTWTIKVDIDWLFHENDMESIRRKLEVNLLYPLGTFQKKTYYPGMKYIQKGQVPIAINKQFKDLIRFGKDEKNYTDLTYPIWHNGKEDQYGVPLGDVIRDQWGKTGETVWNFDYTFKTLAVAKQMFLRGSEAHNRYYGYSGWGSTEDDSLHVFLQNMRGKIQRSIPLKDINELPKYIKERIVNLRPEEFAHSGWGLI